MTDVLLVEDDLSVRDALMQTMELADLTVTTAGSFLAAQPRLTRDLAGIVVTDIRMPGRDGFHLLAQARAADPDLPVILLTGEGDVPTAVRGMSEGAFAFLEKPCDPEELVETVRRALALRHATLEARRERGAMDGGDAAARMLRGISPQSREMRDRARAVARGTGAVLIQGEPGTGTSKLAEVIHLLSPRATGPFVKRSAPALDAESLAEAIMVAEGGSLFIDHIDALPSALQHRLPEDEVPENGGVRLLAATHRDPAVLVEALDPDLFYRLEGLQVHIPPLRDRPGDIPVLFQHYLNLACEQADLPVPDVAPDVQARLMARDWPGNARGLMNHAMRFAMGLPDGEMTGTPRAGLADRMRAVERSILIETLTRHRGQATLAAQDLDLPRKTFYDKLTRHGLKPEDYRPE
ncbi:two-component system, NtrC family, C4-dicarboxylate transport response regulator DctD [Jannaschia faecimaris]|uniref:Two-component system, NtrC family, C4-dicarboxylate transport response regulator DctD n=1 Tax=Jannaschia faecimaris TaxID=1244108 RepID=A0A1H3RSN6_9RHOB|nr:sigma-54 dependent transcriptional regulator [Jannaschia faecimaris]SDZ28620.1 two-component system, NtrC family, C4-dicarboxylate transport response regulator DctD [Jannaschia faecimaris]